MSLRSPAIAQKKSLAAEKEDLKSLQGIINLYNAISSVVQKEDDSFRAQVTASDKDNDDMAKEEVTIPTLPTGAYDAYQLYRALSG